MSFIAIAAACLAVGAALSLVLPNNRSRAAASIASQLIAMVLVERVALPALLHGLDLRAVMPWSYPSENIAAHLDSLGAFFLAWSLPMTALGTIYAVDYLRPYEATRNAGVQYALLNVTALSFLMIYTLETATAFLLGWEIAAVAAWLLVIWDYRNQRIRFAGFNYLVSTHVGFFFLVAAFMVLHSRTGSMDFGAFGSALRTPGTLRNATFLLLVTSFGLKSAFFPFHTWLPRAHSAAPAHVSALMSGVIHKAGLFGLLRFTLLLGEPEPWMGWYLISFSALSAVMGVLYTTAQRDLKRMLGYSSTENVGIAGIGFGLGYLGLAWHQPALVVLGFTGGILHILNHAVFKCLLFYAAGAVYRATHTIDLERLGGLAKRMPWTAGLFLLGGLAISALPPFNGFVSEFLIYAGLLNGAVPPGLERALLISLAAGLAFVGGISALATVRAFGVTFLGTPKDASVHVSGDAPASMRLSMLVHGGGVLALGLAPAFAIRLVEQPVREFAALLRGPSVAATPPVEVIQPVVWAGALLIGAVALLLAVRWMLTRSAPVRQHVTWGCGYAAPSPRMQYTGASFSSRFVAVFESVLIYLERKKLPEGPFPEANSHVNKHCVDAVERRMFEVLGEGESVANRLYERVSVAPTYSLGLGLAVLVVVISLVATAGGIP
ncbi:MAG: proton-conducting membrane transporter [Deltaproteobacteria bacterium]|nr:proton-conducting membrane transporter [Deltaproteobacteria bacterium]